MPALTRGVGQAIRVGKGDLAQVDVLFAQVHAGVDDDEHLTDRGGDDLPQLCLELLVGERFDGDFRRL